MCAVALVGAQIPALAATSVTNWGRAESVVVSEVGCSSSTGKFVEIANLDTKHPVLMSGWVISDQSLDQTNVDHRYVFPKGTAIPAGGYMSFRANVGSELPFDIECAKDKIRFGYKSGENWIVHDSLDVPNLADNVTWSRLLTRVNQWSATRQTKNSKNLPVLAGTVIDRAAFLFDPLKESTIRLTISPESEALLKQQTMENHASYVPATFQLVNPDGQTVPSTPMQVGIRLKGSVGSFRPYTSNTDEWINKSAFKIKFDAVISGQRFFGLKKLTLNSMVQDATMTNEVLTYRLFREMGLTAPRTGFARVNINGQYRGLYLNLEQYDDVSLAWSYPSIDHLYEGKHAAPEPTTPDLLGLNAPAKFPVDEGDSEDVSDLLDLILDLRNSLPAQQNLAARNEVGDIMPKSVDAVQVGKMVAVEKYVSHWDGYSGSPWWTPNNHFLLHPTGQPFQILPWGTDQTWTPVSAEWLPMLENGVESFSYVSTATLFKFCMTDVVCYPTYLKTLEELPKIVTDKNLNGYFTQVFNAHTESRATDWWHGYDENSRLWGIQSKANFIATRASAVSTFTASKLSPQILWTPTTSTILHGMPFTAKHLNAVPTVPGALTYSVKLGSRPTAGSIVVTAQLVPTNPNFPRVSKEVVFTVKDSQVLTVSKIANRKLARSTAANKFTVSAISTSGLLVRSGSTTPSICSVSGKTITMLRKGTCVLAFSQRGNGNYFAATTVQRTFKIT